MGAQGRSDGRRETNMGLMRPGDLCLVTGASGYVASWLVKDLLESGFRVRGTIRSLTDRAKVDALHAMFPDLQLVEADLRVENGWPDAVKDCCWIFHVASPQAVPSESDRTGGAVTGTEYLMRASLAQASVQKIVLTSSEAAIAYGFPRSKQRFTEDDWTVLDGAAGRNDYFRSKTLAERRAWDLASDPLANPRRVPLAVINPGFILGPSLVPWARFSLDMVKRIADGRLPMLPDLPGHEVDVRDCARMHVALMDEQASNGRRHFCFGMTGGMDEIARVIRENYAKIGLSPNPRRAPGWLMWLLSLVSNDVASIYSKLGHPNLYETKWPGAYRYQHTDIEASVKASIDSMLAHGWLKPRST